MTSILKIFCFIENLNIIYIYFFYKLTNITNILINLYKADLQSFFLTN